jgi:hypothetical protein
MATESSIGTSSNFFLGEDKALSFTVYQADGTTAQDITGYALAWMLKKKATDSDATAKITKTTVSGIALTTPLSGICTVTLTDTDTATLNAGVYRHELKRTDDGSETVLSFGTCVLRQGVQR